QVPRVGPVPWIHARPSLRIHGARCERRTSLAAQQVGCASVSDQSRWRCAFVRRGRIHSNETRDDIPMNIRRVFRLLGLVLFIGPVCAYAQSDPGPRPGANGAGQPIAGLTTNEGAFFDSGREDFEEAEGVADGLGPRFNLDGCGGCHLQPDVGGTSPPVNPQVSVATAFGARNIVPSFITLNGPVREARFKRLPGGAADGGVHALYVITGRADSTGSASGCNAVQENFSSQVAANNVIFRIPTPVFGLGLMEEITDQTILQNLSANGTVKAQRGISGRVNRNGNDGRITRFGWK